MLIYVFNVLHY